MAGLLGKAGVSRNAFYTVARRQSVLPDSVNAVAACLGVSPANLLESEDPRIAKLRLMEKRVERIFARYPDVDRDNVRHTLLLLDEDPIERLRRALLRAQKPDLH